MVYMGLRRYQYIISFIFEFIQLNSKKLKLCHLVCKVLKRKRKKVWMDPYI